MGGSLLFVALTVGAPALKDRPADRLYAPIVVGDKQVYEQRGKGTVVRATHVVTKVEERDGALRVTIGREGQSGVWTDLAVSDRGVVWHILRGLPRDPPVPAVKLPAKPGDTWADEPKGSDLRTTYTMATEEEVEVPAGKFRAVRVEAEYVRGGQRERHTFWHAPRVGLVKAVLTTDTAEWTQVLMSFTPGDAPAPRSPAAGKK